MQWILPFAYSERTRFGFFLLSLLEWKRVNHYKKLGFDKKMKMKSDKPKKPRQKRKKRTRKKKREMNWKRLIKIQAFSSIALNRR